MFTLTKLNVLWDKVKALEARPSGGGSDLPEVTSEDAGEVLMVSDTGEWEANEIVGLLPDVDSTDNGKLLGVDDGEWAVVNPPSGGYTISSTEVDTGLKLGNATIYCKQYDLVGNTVGTLITTDRIIPLMAVVYRNGDTSHNNGCFNPHVYRAWDDGNIYLGTALPDTIAPNNQYVVIYYIK